MVVDSLSFESLPNVHVKIKNKELGVVSGERGLFSIKAASFDTLIFSAVGYLPYKLPVLFDEEDIIILMSQDVTYLHPVIVEGKPIRSPLIRDKPIPPPATHAPKKMVTDQGISFSYFSREEREKRRLQKLIEANEKIKGYVNVITDPEFKAALLKKYKIQEEEYNRYLLEFNQTQVQQVEGKTEEEVRVILDKFFFRKVQG